MALVNSYADRVDFLAYMLPVVPELTNAEIDALLVRASDDLDEVIDRAFFSEVTRRRVDAADTTLDSWRTINLRQAACIQGEYRLLMGPEHFLRRVQPSRGPDSTNEKADPLISPRAYKALLDGQWVRLTGTVK